MEIDMILLIVCLSALCLCIGMLFGIFVMQKYDKEYIVDVLKIENEYLNKMTNMIYDDHIRIAGWIDEINKSCYVPVWKYVDKELPECEGLYYGKKDNTNSMWKVIFRNGEWFLSGHPDHKMKIVKWTELY